MNPKSPGAGRRDDVLAGVVISVGRYGLAKVTVDDVVAEAGVSRATLYRMFPGGRDQLIAEGITWEVGRFFTRLGERVADAGDLAELLERGLVAAHHEVTHHEVLAKVVETEPERLLPRLSTVSDLVLEVLRGYLEPWVAAEPLCPGMEAFEGADWLARNVLSFIVSPGGWDLTDPAAVSRLVRNDLLAGVVA